ISSDWAIILATAVVVVLTVLYRPDAKGMVLITAATVAYGYLMKPLGLVVATAALVFISAYGGHEFKWKEVAILYVILIIFSVLVFVKGLTLPFPLWPEYFSSPGRAMEQILDNLVIGVGVAVTPLHLL